MEIINLRSWLLKMPVMTKFHVRSGDRKSGKVIVNLACVYHYCSYLKLPLVPEPNLSTQYFYATFLFKATNEILSLLAMFCLTS